MRMRNPITTLKLPQFKDHMSEFEHFYNIKKIVPLSEEDIFYGVEYITRGQEYRNACAMASLRFILRNDFNIEFKKESDLIRLATDLYEKKQQILGKGYGPEYDIKKHGSYQLHFKNIAEFFGLKCFVSHSEKLKEVTYLIDEGITPIIFRPMNMRDKDGHYVVAYGHDKEKIFLFDPAFRGTRPRDNYPHKGQNRNVPLDIFIEKWHNEHLDGGYIFLCDKTDKPKRRLSGYYMT